MTHTTRTERTRDFQIDRINFNLRFVVDFRSTQLGSPESSSDTPHQHRNHTAARHRTIHCHCSLRCHCCCFDWRSRSRISNSGATLSLLDSVDLQSTRLANLNISSSLVCNTAKHPFRKLSVIVQTQTTDCHRHFDSRGVCQLNFGLQPHSATFSRSALATRPIHCHHVVNRALSHSRLQIIQQRQRSATARASAQSLAVNQLRRHFITASATAARRRRSCEECIRNR